MPETATPGALLPLGGEINAFHLHCLDNGDWQVRIDGARGDALNVGPFTGTNAVLDALAHVKGICLTSYQPADQQ